MFTIQEKPSLLGICVLGVQVISSVGLINTQDPDKGTAPWSIKLMRMVSCFHLLEEAVSTVKRIQYFDLFWEDIFGVISSTLDVKVKLDLFVSEQDRYNEFHLWFDTSRSLRGQHCGTAPFTHLCFQLFKFICRFASDTKFWIPFDTCPEIWIRVNPLILPLACELLQYINSIAVCTPHHSWNPPAEWTGSHPVVYRNFDCPYGLVLMEGTEQADFSLIQGQVIKYRPN